MEPLAVNLQFLDLMKRFNWLHDELEMTLHDQRETARRALLHQPGEILAVTHQFEADARQNLVNALARYTETHRCNVQMQVRHLE